MYRCGACGAVTAPRETRLTVCVYREWTDQDGRKRKDISREVSVCRGCKLETEMGVTIEALEKAYAPPPEPFTQVAPPPPPPPKVNVPVPLGKPVLLRTPGRRRVG